MFTKVRDALNRRRTSADDPDPFVVQLGQAARGIAAGVVVIPAARMKGMAFEVLDPGDRGKVGPIERSARHHDESRPEDVVAIGSNRPSRGGFVPSRVSDLRLEAGPIIQIEVL